MMETLGCGKIKSNLGWMRENKMSSTGLQLALTFLHRVYKTLNSSCAVWKSVMGHSGNRKQLPAWFFSLFHRFNRVRHNADLSIMGL